MIIARYEIMTFDLNIFDTNTPAENGADLHLKHPITGKPVYADDKNKKPVTIKLKGTDSDEYKKIIQRAVRDNQAKKQSQETPDFDEMKQVAAETYAKMSISWQNISVDGKALPFNYDNAVKLYLGYAEITKQVGDFMADRRNFIKG